MLSTLTEKVEAKTGVQSSLMPLNAWWLTVSRWNRMYNKASQAKVKEYVGGLAKAKEVPKTRVETGGTASSTIKSQEVGYFFIQTE
jgi:hypothetical protein